MTTQVEKTPVPIKTAPLKTGRLSYDHCGSTTPLLGETIPRCLKRIAATYPDHEAVVSVHQELRFTYAEMDHIVDNAAKAFLALGIRRGDRVAIWSTNNYEWWVTQFATARIGAVLVNVNPAYRTHELEYVLKESRARALLLIDTFKTSNYIDMFYEVCPEAKDAEPGHIESWRFPNLKSVIFIGKQQYPGMYTRRRFSELGPTLPDSYLDEIDQELDIDDVINIQYTSGTTGFPKGVRLTHNNILNNAFFATQLMKLTDKDRLCVPVPFYHCFGMVVSNLAMMTVGGTLVVPSPVFDVEATLTAVQKEKCTVLHGVPTMFIAMLYHESLDRFDLSSLRTGIMAGAPCPVETMKAVMETMNMKEILIAYGQTESSPLATMTRVDDPLAKRVETVGRVTAHEEIKIVDPQTGRTVPRGMQGEICMRGYHVMRDYDNNPKATAEAIDNRGWLHSGDLGVMDDQGYVSITGRLREMVIRGGENVYPREIEEFLHRLDIIEDAYVVGVPDEKMGEELLACIKLKPGVRPPTDEDLRTLCKGKISHFKIPKYWLVVDEYPMTVTGKIQKFKLAEWGVRQLGLKR